MKIKTVGNLKSSDIVRRHPFNPILTSNDVPYKSDLTFNAGVTEFNGRYVMVFRNDYGYKGGSEFEGTNLGLAFSEDGIKWEVQPKPCFELTDDEIKSAQDPRLTVLENRCYMCFSIIGRNGIRGGTAVTDNFKDFEIIHTTLPDNRNLVLFPEKINEKYYRLDRPFANYLRYPRDSFDIWVSESPDLLNWGSPRLLLKASEVPYCNNRIGPGTPPVKTSEGWLVIFHTVDFDSSRGKNGWEDKWQKRYCAGIMLLDLKDPSKIRGIYDRPVLVPEAPYEISGGFRNNVIFPCGIIPKDSGEVKIYYGAADTVVCLAVADLNDLISLCLN